MSVWKGMCFGNGGGEYTWPQVCWAMPIIPTLTQEAEAVGLVQS